MKRYQLKFLHYSDESFSEVELNKLLNAVTNKKSVKSYLTVIITIALVLLIILIFAAIIGITA